MKYFDERDIIFSRVGLVKNTRKYQKYYSQAPELRNKDDQLRQLLRAVFASNNGISTSKMEKKQRKMFFLNKLINIFTKLTGYKFFPPLKKSFFNFEETSEGIACNSIYPPALAAGFSLSRKSAKTAIAAKKVILPPEKATALIKETARFYGADLVGIAKLKQHHHYTHRGDKFGMGPGYGKPINISYKYAIVVAVASDKTMINHAPGKEISICSMLGYAKSSIITAEMAIYIKSLGFQALTDNFQEYYSPMSPLAVDAGLGQLGRCNMLVNQKLGNRIRLAAVLTSLPLIPDKPVDFGMTEFCRKCGKCGRNCPAKAISTGEPQMINGILQWQHNENKCCEMWMKVGSDCGICLSSCPFSQGVNQELADQMKGNESIIAKIIAEDNKVHGRRVFLKESWPPV
ncbi:reductive dehalogenase domain-containing protein [Lentisphaerota bacterium ZTH]|nr:hypothetical protein JYG24_08600 [Lentisphaerota bacterium]WET06448.1 reductive dehalogenase domain-containing protein [Lentisphaerota bacterium ZTH]